MKDLEQIPRLKIALGLLLIGVLLFGSSVTHPFHFDDALITGDSNVTNTSHWRYFFNPLHLRELTFFSFYLNVLAFGTGPASFHVVNVALHLANVVLLFVLLDGLVERWVAVAAALIFLVHPIQTEPVLYVYQRSLLLACFFSLLALLALRRQRYFWTIVLLGCAFEAKEAALAGPLAIAIFYHSPHLQEGKPAKEWLYRGMFFLAAIGMGAGALYLLARNGESTVGIGAAAHIRPLTYFLTQTRVVYTYLRLLFFPVSQSIEYDFIWQRSGLNAAVWVRLLGLAALVVLAIALYRKANTRVWGFSILCFFILLAPTSSWIPSNDAAFEHRLYLPMLAFSLLLASIIARVPGRNVLLGGLVLVLSLLSFSRERIWASDVRLWEDAVQHAPGKARAWFNLGGAAMDREPDKARAALNKALALQPQLPEAWYDLGVIDAKSGNIEKAYEEYQTAVKQEPDYWPAWNNLGNALFAKGERDRAIDNFETTLRLNPDYWPAQYNIAVAQYTSGRYDKAIPRLRTVLDWRPDFKEARYLLAMALRQTGDQSGAQTEWRKVGDLAGQPPMPALIPSTTH